jgi:hypothetical protein
MVASVDVELTPLATQALTAGNEYLTNTTAGHYPKGIVV